MKFVGTVVPNGWFVRRAAASGTENGRPGDRMWLFEETLSVLAAIHLVHSGWS